MTMPSTLADHFSAVPPLADIKWEWAFKNYKSTILETARRFNSRSLCEIGGGRSPLLEKAMVDELDADYTILDIAQSELDKAPSWPEKLCCDIAGAAMPKRQGSGYDLMFSHMVMEHLKDVRQGYRNIYELLADGGIVINFHPTLYAVPFLINYILPDEITRPILERFDPARGETGRPKFPARYSWCLSTAKAEGMIREVGFREVLIIPFWGHFYFKKIPLIRSLDAAIVAFAKRHGIRALSSYAYSIARR